MVQEFACKQLIPRHLRVPGACATTCVATVSPVAASSEPAPFSQEGRAFSCQRGSPTCAPPAAIVNQNNLRVYAILFFTVFLHYDLVVANTESRRDAGTRKGASLEGTSRA